jgi:hypothetical protein
MAQIRDSEWIWAKADYEMGPADTQDEIIIGTRQKWGIQDLGSGISLTCPEVCAFLLPNTVGFVDLARRCGKKVARLDEKLRRGQLKILDRHAVLDDLNHVWMMYWIFVAMIVFGHSGYEENQLESLFQPFRSFRLSTLGYWSWVLFPGDCGGDLRDADQVYFDIKMVRRECQHCRVQGWLIRTVHVVQ